VTIAAPTFSQIKAQVAAIRQKVPHARVIGIRAEGRWAGERLKQDGQETFRIEQCDSPLHMRMVLQDDDGMAITVLITSLDERVIGDDILVRLARRRLFPIDSWQIVKLLFQARAIDPRVTQHGWMAEHLLEAIPADGFPPAPGGFLDAETVWSILLNQRIGFVSDRPDLLALLQWSINTESIAQFQATPVSFRQTATEWLTQQVGPAAEAVLHCIAANKHPDTLAVGLAAGVVFNGAAAGQLDKAAGKLEERYLGGKTLDGEIIDRWHAAATEVVSLQLTDAQLKRRQLNRADEILREVQADAYAYLSRTSPLGFDQRLARFGTLLSAIVLDSTPASLELLIAARQEILGHDQAQRERRRLDRIDMALRLIQWLTRVDAAATSSYQSLAEAAAHHLAEGGFVDWARLSLRGGEPVRELSEAYARLFNKVTAIREQQARQFAELLRDWTDAGSVGDGVIPVERILDELVAPLAAQARLLVIVLDGMSAAVCRELVGDITRQDWVVLCKQAREANRPGLAALPSITEVSRTSLLCGQLRPGNATVEKSGFAEHPGLRAHCRSGSMPILFHKSSLQEADDTSLAAEVRGEIAAAHRRVVGVVVNAVDDYLLKGEQIDTRWSCEEIKVLPTLLHEAKSARRIVILLADHGHVLDHQTQGRPHEGGERWRIDDGNFAADEVQMTGSRVVIPENHRLIAPWTEKVRYGVKKNGYHGGVSPQEMIIPITVLYTGDAVPAGWREAPITTPAWWDEPFLERQPGEEVPLLLKPVTPKGLGPLFDSVPEDRVVVQPTAVGGTPEETVPAWITALLASPILAEQKRLAGRTVPADEIIIKLLNTLDCHGGKLTATALTRAIEYPSLRLRGLLAVMQRVLNIDGYAVLTRDEASDTIELDRDLLCRQFDLVSG
jgi:PglZ domain